MQYLLPFQQNLHTPGHIDCPACLEARQQALMRISGEMRFENAAAAFRELKTVAGQAPADEPALRARYVRENTLKGYDRHAAALNLFFGGMRLDEIRWWHMRAYQKARFEGAPPFIRLRRPQDAKAKVLGNGTVLAPLGPTSCPAKPQQVNQELDYLKRLKRLAGCWEQEDDNFYESLQETESETPRALSADEQERWLATARSQQRWELVWLYSIVAFDTCCSTNELRGLRLGDVRLGYQMIAIPWPAAKNRYRHREIAIESADTLWALEKLIGRAKEYGAAGPADYLFPQRDKRTRKYDPARPMSGSGLKKLWQEVRQASGLVWFRPYDTRHTAATRLAEAGVPVDIIVARMGHCGERMREHYTHIGLAAQRRWLRKPPKSACNFSGDFYSFPLVR